MKRVSLTPAVFHLPPEVNAVAATYGDNPIVPRGPGLAPVLERLQRRLPEALGCEQSHHPILLGASGSGAIAASIGSCVGERGILVISNGAYGQRQARYARQLGLPVFEHALPYGERPDPETVAALAQEHGVGAIGMVHGATSTCSVNPISEIGEVAHRLGLTFIVDAIASVFVETLDVAACHIDVLIASANKGLHSNPDIAFVLVKREMLDALEAEPGRIPYLDLGEACRAQRKGSHPYTINVRALLEMDAALDALAREGGVAGRVAIYRARASLLRAGYAELGLTRFERPGMPLQNIGTALMLPAGVQYATLAGKLASYPGPERYEIYSAQGPLAAQVFRIFHMGEYELPTYERFLHALGEVLAAG